MSALEVLSLVITAAATVTIAVLTGGLIVEQRRLRREAAMPVVIAYLEVDPDELNIINFLVRNVGGGVAQSIELRTLSNSHVERLGLSAAWKPIGSLPQGGVYRNFLGSALDPPAEPLEVEVAYQDLGGQRHSKRFVLDVAQFEKLSKVDVRADRLYRQTEALESISRSLEQISRALERLR